MNELDGQTSSNAERLVKAEGEVHLLQKQKEHLEESLRVHSSDMQKFQLEYEEQLAMWKKEKGEMQGRIQELAVLSDRLKLETADQVENYKRKYLDYKAKVTRANASIQTLTTRLAKYELQLQQEREIGRVDSVRKLAHFGSDFSANQVVGGFHHGHNSSGNMGGFKSAGSALSPAAIGHPYDNFNMGDQYTADIENHELNEEIKKLLMENQA